jgi:hypothetical protein
LGEIVDKKLLVLSALDAAAHLDKNETSSGRSDRQERVSIPFWTTKAAKKKLKILAVEEECTQQALLQEALDLLFQSRDIYLPK